MSVATDSQLFHQLVTNANALFLSDADFVTINGITKPTLKKIYAEFLASMGVYTTVAAGLAATSGTGTNNRFFTVQAAGDKAEVRYRNDAGVAVEISSLLSWNSDSLTINRGKVYPLRRMTRNGVTSAEPTAFSKAILNICIIGARPGKYYRLAYFVNGSAAVPGAKPDGWIIEEIDQENYATAANPATTVIALNDAATPTISRDGIQTVVLSSSVVQDLRILISLDTAQLPAFGTPIGANGAGQAGYSYVIDPSRYIPAKSDSTNSININSAQIVPFRLLSRGGGVSTPNALQTIVILHARVINAKQGKYYGLRYFQNGSAAVVPAADNWIIEEVDIVGYDASIITAATSIATLSDAQPAIDRTLGIQTILLRTKTDVQIEVTLDASKLAAYGTHYGMNFTPQNGYSHVIDPACYESPRPVPSAGGARITYQVDFSGNVAFSWPDGVGTRGFEFGPNGANSLANFRKVLRNGGVVLAMATDWAPPVTFEAARNGDGRIPLEFTGGNHLVNDLKTAQSVSFVMEADGVPLKPGDSGTADKLVCYVVNKLMASNTVSLDRYCLLQSLQLDFVPGAANVHADYLALEDLQMYIDYACQIVTTTVNDKLFYLGGQFPEPIDWDGKVNSGNAIDYPDAWAVITTSANGQLTAWIDRDYGIAKSRQVDPVRGMIRGGGDASTKQYTTAYNRPLVRNPTTPNYIALAAGERYQWRGGYSWGPVDVKAGFVASTRYLDGDRIRRADAVSALAVLNP
ncbi:hypothetical protein D3C79_329590 [compost metagenome]